VGDHGYSYNRQFRDCHYSRACRLCHGRISSEKLLSDNASNSGISHTLLSQILSFMWRAHSCVPCRDSSRHRRMGDENTSRASTRVSTRHAEGKRHKERAPDATWRACTTRAWGRLLARFRGRNCGRAREPSRQDSRRFSATGRRLRWGIVRSCPAETQEF
jgi:hypothetical protein